MGLRPDLKEVEVHGKPGNVCAIYRISDNPDFRDLPTKGLAWGLFDKDGLFKAILDPREQERVAIFEYEPQVAAGLERSWHVNSEA